VKNYRPYYTTFNYGKNSRFFSKNITKINPNVKLDNNLFIRPIKMLIIFSKKDAISLEKTTLKVVYCTIVIFN